MLHRLLLAGLLATALSAQTATPFGVGCGWSAQVPVPGWDPVLGGAYATHIDRIQFSATSAHMAVDTVLLQPPTDLTPFGMTNCTAYVGTAVFETLGISNGSAAWFINIPNDPAFLGTQLITQGWVWDPSVGNPAGVYTTNGILAVIGP